MSNELYYKLVVLCGEGTDEQHDIAMRYLRLAGYGLREVYKAYDELKSPKEVEVITQDEFDFGGEESSGIDYGFRF